MNENPSPGPTTRSLTLRGPLEASVIVITGATGGIGQVAAKTLAKAGASLVLIARSIPRLEALYDEMAAEGLAQPALHPLDLSGATEADFVTMAQAIRSEFGRLDGMIHGAAELGDLRPEREIDWNRWQRQFTVNLTAPILMTRTLVPLMIESGGGQILFMDDSSCGAGKAFWGGYGVAKAGLRHYASMLTAELSTFGVCAQCYAPGPVKTNIRLRAYAGENPENLPSPETKAGEILSFFTR